VLEPRLVEELVDREVVLTKISCGTFHMAALSDEGEVWTWGKNDFGCLGRPGSLRNVGGTRARCRCLCMHKRVSNCIGSDRIDAGN
jgi:alpha-tubulin suppressor-like RCC1 family protein